jgi:hypothetical protein
VRVRGEMVNGRRALALAVLLLTSYFSPLTSQAIQDNSFLLEETYNQERVSSSTSVPLPAPRVGIGSTRLLRSPLGGIRHQLGYTVPIQHAYATGTGLGDIAF